MPSAERRHDVASSIIPFVVVSSVVGYISTPLRSGYCAAKHALHGFYEAAAAELHRDNVKFTLACPGYVRTQVSMHALSGNGGEHGVMDPGIANGLDPAVCAQKIWRAVERPSGWHSITNFGSTTVR